MTADEEIADRISRDALATLFAQMKLHPDVPPALVLLSLHRSVDHLLETLAADERFTAQIREALGTV